MCDIFKLKKCEKTTIEISSNFKQTTALPLLQLIEQQIEMFIKWCGKLHRIFTNAFVFINYTDRVFF